MRHIVLLFTVALAIVVMTVVMASSAFALGAVGCAGGIGRDHTPPQADLQLLAHNPNC